MKMLIAQQLIKNTDFIRTRSSLYLFFYPRAWKLNLTVDFKSTGYVFSFMLYY